MARLRWADGLLGIRLMHLEPATDVESDEDGAA